MLYGFSVFHCLTQSLAENDFALGICMGPAKTESLLGKADCEHFADLNITSK